MEILLLGGNGQFGEPDTPLGQPLEVRVQALATGNGEEGVRVRWRIVGGNGGHLAETTTLTDSAGIASAGFTLGSALGSYQVRASVSGMVSPPVEFLARAILVPELLQLPSEGVEAGDTILLQGRNLSTTATDNVVTFSRVRGRVVSATATELQVEVPRCLPSRSVNVRIQIGTLSTREAALQVSEGGGILALGLGEDVILDASNGLSCFHLPSIPDSYYLVVPHTTGTIAGAQYPLGVVGLTRDGLFPPPRRQDSPGISPQGFLADDASTASFGQDEIQVPPAPNGQWAWNMRIRDNERRILADRAFGGGVSKRKTVPAAESSASSIPAIGDRREFNLLNLEDKFEKISAAVELITPRSIIYVDEAVPPGGFTSDDLVYLAGHFDDHIHPTVSEAFGSESDLDGNDRVVILFTAGVNRLTPPGSDGYVGGFFYGLDLLEGRNGSNEGEIFYAVVPDPSGVEGPRLTRNTLLYHIPAIMAHEFEHMVHFNRRILVAGAEGQDALWLAEALAQMAEDLVGTSLDAMGDHEAAQRYQWGNWQRARRFLQDPSQVSLLAAVPPGTLAERGAGWLMLKYLYGQEEREYPLKDLTASTRVGVENITHSLGRNWTTTVSNWAGALFLDGVSVPVRQELAFNGVNLRDVLSRIDGSFPLDAIWEGAESFVFSGSLWSSAPEFYILNTPESGGVAINVSGLEGRPMDPASNLRILVVRLQ